MTLALSHFKAYGVEIDEPVTNQFIQRMEMTLTGAATDVTYDFGTYAGTFWTAVGSTEPGTTALKAIKDIQTLAKSFLNAQGSGLASRAQADASYTSSLTIDSAASSGGNATESLTFTGLTGTDSILALTQRVAGANSVALRAFGSPGTNSLSVTYTADPGANSIVRALVSRTLTTVNAGTYTLALDGTNTKLPNIVFGTADAPTSQVIVLEWEMKQGEVPVQAEASA